MLPKSAQKARKIIVPTEAVKKDLLANIKNIEEDKISIIPWGIEENFKPVEDIPIKEKTAIQYGLPPKFILHVGRNEPKKNTVKMVEAYFAATMAAKLPHRLVMAGPKGWGMSSFDKAIRELGLEDRVVRLGYVPDKDLATIYSMADATLFPSLVEGFGFPVLESMACGTPVIAGDIPSLREVASSAAHFVNPESLPSIREGIEVILQDEARRNTLIEKGYRQAAKFTWQRHAESLVKLYKTIFD
jgi:glycosyltransferase involved in cell wall biosynthesis